MIDIRKLKELVRLMVANDLIELDLRDADEQVTLRRPGPQLPPQIMQTAMPAMHAMPMPSSAVAPAAPTDSSASAAANDAGLVKIESPMVGTFYSSPNPDSPAFVKVGDHVSPDSPVCLVEAMKIFNEIKAECSGRIERVLVKNREAIEFGQPLFLVRPD